MLPSGESAGVVPSPSFLAPPPPVPATQMTRSLPRGSAVGFATHPARLGCVPRTNVTTLRRRKMLMSAQLDPVVFESHS